MKLHLPWRLVLSFALLLIYTHRCVAQEGPQQEQIRPSEADPRVQQFDQVNVVLTPTGTKPSSPLAIFLPGTNGRPLNALKLMNVVAGQGYRVIGLSYDDAPPGVDLCPRNPNPNCFAAFRAMRSFGQGPAPVDNSYAESIEGRLVSVLRFLDREHPGSGWSNYLTADGHPNWSRILVSGLSQGAGMAAYIAKVHSVYRVVLFSSPWDFIGPRRVPAPWLYERSATPVERWWAERHVQENTTTLIANAYSALHIPQGQILLFDQGLAPQQSAQEKNPFHGSTILNPAYTPQWRIMFGSAEHGDN